MQHRETIFFWYQILNFLCVPSPSAESSPKGVSTLLPLQNRTWTLAFYPSSVSQSFLIKPLQCLRVLAPLRLYLPVKPFLFLFSPACFLILSYSFQPTLISLLSMLICMVLQSYSMRSNLPIMIIQPATADWLFGQTLLKCLSVLTSFNQACDIMSGWNMVRIFALFHFDPSFRYL